MFTEEKKNSQIYQDSNHFKPDTEIVVSNLVKDFYKKKLPINLHGTNSKKYIGYNVQAAKTLDLSYLNGVIEYLPEELYIKVLAGTPIKIIEDLLEKHNQQLAFEPLDFGYINDGFSDEELKSKNLFIEVEKQKYPIEIQLEPLKRTDFKNL